MIEDAAKVLYRKKWGEKPDYIDVKPRVTESPIYDSQGIKSSKMRIPPQGLPIIGWHSERHILAPCPGHVSKRDKRKPKRGEEKDDKQ